MGTRRMVRKPPWPCPGYRIHCGSRWLDENSKILACCGRVSVPLPSARSRRGPSIRQGALERPPHSSRSRRGPSRDWRRASAAAVELPAPAFRVGKQAGNGILHRQAAVQHDGALRPGPARPQAPVERRPELRCPGLGDVPALPGHGQARQHPAQLLLVLSCSQQHDLGPGHQPIQVARQLQRPRVSRSDHGNARHASPFRQGLYASREFLRAA